MNCVRHDLITRLWRCRDPFLDLPPDLREVEMGGSSQRYGYVGPAVASTRPGVVVDVGAGKGGSTIAFARELSNTRLDAVVIAVDTFLGDVTDWVSDEKFEAMEYEAGRSSLYSRFVSNVLHAGLGNFVLPLTLDATTAAALFAKLEISVNVVHLDAGNDAASIWSYLEAWWPVLALGGVLIGGPSGNGRDPARQAYEDFCAAQGVEVTFHDGKCQSVKPGGAVAPVLTPAAAGALLGPASPLTTPGSKPAVAQGVNAQRKSATIFRLGARPMARRPDRG
jgi:hypothetical protein